MKIAFICTESLPSPAIRGGAIQMMVDGVAPILAEKHQLTIFSITDPDLPDYERKGNLKYVRVQKENFVSHISRHLSRRNFDMIHVFNRPHSIVEYKKAAPNSLFVLGLHNDMLSEQKITTEQGVEVINLVDQIVTISDFIKELIIERFPEARPKIKVVYSGVDLTDYPPIWSDEGQQIREIYRDRYNLQDKKVILFVGRLSKSKGPHLLIQAMKHVLKEHDDAVLVIAGGKWFSDNTINPYVAKLYRLARQFRDRIIFTKFIPASEIPNIFLMSDLFVCSSQWEEPLARVHYEAMAAGIPIITTKRGGNSEVILHGFNGCLLEKYDQPQVFANAINFLLENQSFTSWMARNGRTFVEANFQFKHVACRIESTYIALLKQHLQQQLVDFMAVS